MNDSSRRFSTGGWFRADRWARFVMVTLALSAASPATAIIPALLGAEYQGTVALNTGNTPSLSTGTDFGESHAGQTITRTYTLRHFYPVLYPNTISINAITSSSPDFVIDQYSCGPLPHLLTPPSPISCEIRVSYRPIGATWGARSGVIEVGWTQNAVNVVLSFNVAGVAIPRPCTLDIDGNGVVDALTDGLIMVRAMLGLTGNAVTSGVIGAGATRSVWMTSVSPTVDNSIRLYLNSVCGRNFPP